MKNNLQDTREKRGVRNSHNIISIIFLSLVSIMALSFSIFLLVKNARLQREEAAFKKELEAINGGGFYTAEEAQKLADDAAREAREGAEDTLREDFRKKLESGDTAIGVVRDLFPGEIVVNGSGRYFFFPISDEIEHHGFAETDFELSDNGFIKYVGDKDLDIKNGIDVSRFQGDIDWEKVAASGIDYAMIRAGYRGTGEGKLVEDDKFVDNIEGAIENGIDVGVYFYSQAVNKKEALEEAQKLLDMIEPYNIEYPVVIDIESAESDEARTATLSSDVYEENAKAFCDTISAAGYKPMIYGNVKSFSLLMDAADVDDYDIWIAYYGNPQYYPYHFNMWQYTSAGKVKGIEGDVDLNICITEY
ncbi:hypothetical protein D6853_03385 [Butyrivibrio sp. X503]|uniref:glycoside hydrolase family 25 protein n=1 Tax=Butyrivibrio sp. X503 TaxID=2364878 RepID=UPI000EA9DB6C|nr:glycoside hydrolase family 25 protein [Butyrivibrio sp. X503]RKM57073.1 hypothetical protein D6853_03385 [Butyrivibrio sp. X503]